MPKQMNEREKFLHEVAAIKKVGLLMLDLPPAKRRIVMDAVISELQNPSIKTAGTKRRYTRKKKAAKKGGRKKIKP